MNIELAEKYNMLSKGDRVLCAVSGGADSMCLLQLMRENADKLGITVVAAHFNHRLRGAEADRDEDFVRSWCKCSGTEFCSGSGDVKAYAGKNHLGTEEAARILRYEFLENCAAERGCNKIATAHNADDNAETVLLNLSRGAGAKGLCGIPPVREKFIRPILDKSRAEIEAYLREKGIPHVEDSTNAEDDYSRNRIRHNAVPVLREINPAFSEAVLRTSELLRDDENCLNDITQSFIDENLRDNAIACDKLNALPKAIRSRVVRLMCPKQLSVSHVDALLFLAEGEGLGYADVPGLRVSRDNGYLIFGAESEKLPELEIRIGECVKTDKISISAEICDSIPKVYNSFNTFCFKYGSVCGNMFLTSRRDGDKIRLSYRKCTKSLKELFREAKLSQTQRDKTPVIRDEKGVIAVGGFGVCERCAAKIGDKAIIITVNIISGVKTENDQYER